MNTEVGDGREWRQLCCPETSERFQINIGKKWFLSIPSLCTDPAYVSSLQIEKFFVYF